MDQPSQQKNAYLLITIGVLAVSTAAILIKFALPSASPLAISFYRLFFSALIAVGIYSESADKVSLKNLTARQKTLLLLAGVFLALHFAVWTWSLKLLSVSSSVFFVTTTPLWVGLLTPLIFKQKVTSRFYLGVMVAILGGIVIAFLSTQTGNGTGSSPFGYLLALAGAWMASAYFMIGKKLSDQIPTKLYVAIVYTVASLVLGLFMLTEQKEGLLNYPPLTYLLFILMAIIPQTLGHTSFNAALRFLPASTVSLALLFEPVGSTILAIFLLKEIPSMAEIIGGILILIGLMVAIKPQINEV